MPTVLSSVLLKIQMVIVGHVPRFNLWQCTYGPAIRDSAVDPTFFLNGDGEICALALILAVQCATYLDQQQRRPLIRIGHSCSTGALNDNLQLNALDL